MIPCMGIFSSCRREKSEIGRPYAGWKEGEMDIHHIYTGRGESSFLIFPDGTSMLIDAGDYDPATPGAFNFRDIKMCDLLPDSSRRAGEWIARYIEWINPAKTAVDYLLLSHFHSDHAGDTQNPATRTQGREPDYVLTGIPEVGEYIRFGKAVDRGYPDYQYPKPVTDIDFCADNYRAFLQWKMKREGMQAEGIDVGSREQFVLLKNPQKYGGLFEIRNLAANGRVWTGEGKNTVNYYDLNPEHTAREDNENKKSIGMRITYGPFRYFTAGDFSETLPDAQGREVNIEEEIGKVCGPVHVCKANHHAFLDAMSEGFIRNVRASAYIIPVWDYLHIQPSTMTNMASRELYPDSRIIFPTAFPEVVREAFANEPWMASVCPTYGHVVIKVFDQGKKYRIYVLSARDERRTVEAVYDFVTEGGAR
ncbi:MAG: MBL fold metallo-hydrolase [Tannerella sp.]|nr:MBL fold metallo-hydrolase [Tannerella sp.]